MAEESDIDFLSEICVKSISVAISSDQLQTFWIYVGGKLKDESFRVHSVEK